MDSTTQRKIELQSPEDLSYLIANVRRAAAESIDAAFPPVEGADGQEDELRVRIEQMVNDYITQTFTLASKNISINGLPVNPSHHHLSLSPSSSSSPTQEPQIQYEPFDARLREKMESLAREEEDLLRSIAQLKRRVPSTTAAAFASASRAGIQADEAALANARERVESEAAAASGAKALEGVGPLDRQAEVEKRYRATVETLVGLKKDMPATVAKMERARVAAGYVATEL
ncbi:hypothetical protein QBC47DRAFT_327009 [Echria macrotheca]|uniref:Kinetochore protein mis14 n=1 Tax=Echria macrotheca TaxID=438768 RepID=A0AAJ0B992_9PEZI|nr:hypothetical protein QBC47DRAFT_327009 [Echria macrotheca]